MTIYLDVSAGVNVKAGLGRYCRTLTTAMLPHLDEPPTLFYNTITERSQLPQEWTSLPQKTIHRGYKVWRMQVWMGQLFHQNFQRLVPQATLFHGMEHLLMPLKNIPTVITVHDLIFKLFPEHHKKLNYIFLNQAMPLFVKRADHIITISESSKRDLIEHYHTPPEKISVIYEAAAPDFRPPTAVQINAAKNRYHLPEQFLLVVGTIEPRKNYSRLIEALMQLRAKHPDLKLVVVGSKGWLYESFFQKIADLNATDHVIFTGFVSDEDLPAVYAAATITVMASIYEGFGLPILEAMACGTPVVSSNRASLPELGGNAAYYFNPEDIEEMAAVINTVLEDSALRITLRDKGVEQAARFSWEKTAQETIAIYRQLLS